MKPMALVCLCGTFAGFLASPAFAEAGDPRIRVLDYVPNSVIPVPVSKSVVTRIVLERGERIIAAATGVPSKCDNDAHLWCIVADVDANEVWVKPKAGAIRNNLELKTDRRDYSIELSVGSLTTYRVVLRYAEAIVPVQPGAASEADRVSERIKTASPEVKNLAYTLQANGRGADITPRAVFDDGRFTYFRFPGNADLPTIFLIGADGKEARTNFAMQDDYVVVQRLSRQFVLRLGRGVVSVWNEKFDAVGRPATDGTTVEGLVRQTVGERR